MELYCISLVIPAGFVWVAGTADPVKSYIGGPGISGNLNRLCDEVHFRCDFHQNCVSDWIFLLMSIIKGYQRIGLAKKNMPLEWYFKNLDVYFSSHFPQNSQYLVNGELDQKSVTNKKDAKFNFLAGMCHQIYCIFNQKIVFPILKKLLKNSKNLIIS